ncbi:MAG: hypothetical protein WCJ70_01070 [bacterium]
MSASNTQTEKKDNYNVFVIDGTSTYVDYLKNIGIPEAGCNFVGSASTFEEGMTAVDSFGKWSVDAVIVGGNLSVGAKDAVEGGRITQKIRKDAPGVSVIGMGKEPVPGADCNPTKSNIGQITQLLVALRERKNNA